MAQNNENRDNEGLSTLSKDAQWCQTENNSGAESNRTEFYEFPYHYWDALSRSPNPDNGLAPDLRTTVVADTTPGSVGRSLTLVTSQQTPKPAIEQ